MRIADVMSVFEMYQNNNVIFGVILLIFKKCLENI